MLPMDGIVPFQIEKILYWKLPRYYNLSPREETTRAAPRHLHGAAFVTFRCVQKSNEVLQSYSFHVPYRKISSEDMIPLGTELRCRLFTYDAAHRSTRTSRPTRTLAGLLLPPFLFCHQWSTLLSQAENIAHPWHGRSTIRNSENTDSTHSTSFPGRCTGILLEQETALRSKHPKTRLHTFDFVGNRD